MPDTMISHMPDAGPLLGPELIPLVQSGINVKTPIAALATAAAPAARRQRLVTTAVITVAPNDQIINCKIPAPAAASLPLAASRNGVPLTFKDLGQATANNITLTPSGGEKIDGLASYVIRNNFAYVTLMPLNDGTSVGWMVL